MMHPQLHALRQAGFIASLALLISTCGTPPPTPAASVPTPASPPTSLPPTSVPPTSVPPTPSPANKAPSIVTLAASPAQICPGQTTSLVAVVTDPDGDALNYTWLSNIGTISDQTNTPDGSKATYLAASTSGEDIIKLTVTDARGEPARGEAKVEVRGDCEPELRITNPDTTLSCSRTTPFCQFKVEGTTTFVTSRSDFNDLRLYVLVFPESPPGSGYYIQIQTASIRDDGGWSQSPSYIGHEQAPAATGHTLKLIAVLVSNDAMINTAAGPKPINQLTPDNNGNVVNSPRDITAKVFLVSDEINVTIDKQ